MANERMKKGMKSTAHALGIEASGSGGEHGTAGRVDQGTVESIIESWPEMPRQVADTVMEKYGPPNEATPSRLIWFGNGVWKRTIVYRDEVPHNFPKPLSDLLEQFIDYQVPIEKVSDIAAYDGSVVIERTKGEVSARCDTEEMNNLALNLMHEIATGKRSTEDARREYAEQATAFMLKKPAPYAERLQFEVPRGGTADLAEVTPGPMMKEATALGREKG